MITLFFILLITGYIIEDRKLPAYLRVSNPFLTGAVVMLYVILVSLMCMEILFYLSMFGSVLFGIASVLPDL